MTYQVEHQCPQCSAPIVLSEDDHLLNCPYCRVHLYLSFEGHPRYYLSPRCHEALPFFVPYWRSKGIEFAVRAGRIQKSAVDKTWNASGFSCFPSSLGARPQTQTLYLAEPGEERKLLPTSLPPDEPPSAPPLSLLIGRDLQEAEGPLLFRAFLRDTSSLIYLPAFEKEGMLYDGIDSKILGNTPEGLSGAGWPEDGVGAFRYHFVPAICPNCGNDLAGERQSLIVFCPSCAVGFSVSNSALQDTPFSIAKGVSKTASFLPFWRIRVETEGLPLPTTTGRILPGGRIEQLDRDNFFFWTPAFRINPQLFLRLAHRATIAQLGTEANASLPSISSIAPVTVTSTEAVKTVKILMVLLSPRDHELPSRLNDLSIDLTDCMVVLVPFEQKGYELMNGQIQAAVHVNALKHGQNL